MRDKRRVGERGKQLKGIRNDGRGEDKGRGDEKRGKR